MTDRLGIWIDCVIAFHQRPASTDDASMMLCPADPPRKRREVRPCSNSESDDLVAVAQGSSDLCRIIHGMAMKVSHGNGAEKRLLWKTLFPLW